MPTNQEKVSQLLDTIRSCSKIQLYKLWLLLRAKTIFTTSTTTWSPNVKKAVGRNSRTAAKKVGEWCKEHWKEILITVTIVIWAVLAIVAVVASGGLALVPLLTTTLTTFGISAGTALTIATVTSYTVAAIAILSTLESSTLNIIDTWWNIDNSVFNTFQNILNWTSTISNCFYSIGSIYSSVKEISNADLRNYGKQWTTNPQFRSAISGASEYNFTLKSDSSTFWSGIGDEGICNGDQIAANCADKMGRSTLETTLSSKGVELPNWDVSNPSTISAWNSASSSYAMHSLGNVEALLGNTVRPTSVWNVFERTILRINPNVGNITIYTPTAVNVITHTTQVGSLIRSLFIGTSQTGILLNDWNKKWEKLKLQVRNGMSILSTKRISQDLVGKCA